MQDGRRCGPTLTPSPPFLSGARHWAELPQGWKNPQPPRTPLKEEFTSQFLWQGTGREEEGSPGAAGGLGHLHN